MNLDIFPSKMLSGGLVCVICNSKSFHSFLFKLCLMIVQILKMCTESPRVRALPVSLHCVLEQDTLILSLVLVQPRKTPPYIAERLLMGCKESNQTNKQNQTIFIFEHQFFLSYTTYLHISLSTFNSKSAIFEWITHISYS